MKRLLRRFKRTNIVARISFIVVGLAYLISFIFFAKNIISLVGVETLIRYIVLFLLFGYFLFYSFIGLIFLLKKKYVFLYMMSFVSAILIFVFCVGSHFIGVFYNTLSGLNENENVIYTSYLISLKDTTLNSKSTIGMVADEEDIEGYVLANQIISEYKLKQKVKKYKTTFGSSYIDMLYDLYEGNVDAIFVSSNYVTLYSSEEDFKNLAKETKIIYQTSGKYSNKDSFITSDKSLTEPFTVLIMGVDSEYEGLSSNAAFNGDTLILASLNPKTLSATLLSIPRDTYVPIACRKNSYAKINSSAYSGTSCVINTIEQLMGIKIDYYAKINFKGVVDLVEAVDGIEVDVEAPDYQYNHGFDCKGMVCEQNSDRKWGEDTIYIAPGMQKLNGEQALAYARCRGLYLESDLARNRHQQDLIMALAGKIMQTGDYNKFKKILDAVSNNISTNMNVNQILSSYNMLKNMVGNLINDQEVISIQKAALETYPLNVYLTNSGRVTSALGYYEDSLNDIIKAMKVNLELEEPDIIKSFSYSLNDNYEQIVAGKGLRTGATNSVLKSFVNQEIKNAEKYCVDNDFDCSFKFVGPDSEYYNSDIANGLITAQNPHQGTLLKEVRTITFYVNDATIVDENKENELPNVEEDNPEVEEDNSTIEDGEELEEDVPSDGSNNEDVEIPDLGEDSTVQDETLEN